MKINVSMNMDELAEAIGTIYGIDSGISHTSYLEGLISGAYEKATNEFDLAAAGAAGSGYLTHVYEFGTAGITRGPVRFPDPTSPMARLWVHNISGKGQVQDISFVFRPAVSPNPQPTTERTGVPSAYLRKLSRRKYIFRDKAMVMESGASVNIRPKNGRLLFVPFYNETSDQPRTEKGQFTNREGVEKGFIMTPKPVTVQPGANSMGTFTGFWNAWWSGRGEPLMTGEMLKNVNNDVSNALAASDRVVGGRTAKTTNLDSRVASAKARTEARLSAQTQKRKRKT